MSSQFIRMRGDQKRVLACSEMTARIVDLRSRSAQEQPVRADTRMRVDVDWMNEVVLIGGWRSGLSCHKFDGQFVWGKQLNEINDVTVSRGEVGISLSRSSVVLLDAGSGNEIVEIDRADQVLFSSDSNLKALLLRGIVWLWDRSMDRRVETGLQTYGLLNYAVGDASCAVSSANGDFCVIDTSNGETIVNLRFKIKFFNVLTCAWSPSFRSYLAVLTGYEGRSEFAIIGLSESDLRVRLICRLSPIETAAFFDSGEKLALSDGRIVDVQSGSFSYEPLLRYGS